MPWYCDTTAVPDRTRTLAPAWGDRLFGQIVLWPGPTGKIQFRVSVSL